MKNDILKVCELKLVVPKFMHACLDECASPVTVLSQKYIL